MSKRQLVVLQSGILAIIFAILFPPYGYSRWTLTTYTADLKGVYEIETNNSPWQHVGYAFILSAPPASPLSSLDRERSYDTDIKISGHVLAAEIAVIVLLTAGAFITLGYKRNDAVC